MDMSAANLMKTIARLEADRGTFTVEAEIARMTAVSEKRAQYRAAGGDMDALDREIERQQRITDQAMRDGEYLDRKEA